MQQYFNVINHFIKILTDLQYYIQYYQGNIYFDIGEDIKIDIITHKYQIDDMKDYILNRHGYHLIVFETQKIDELKSKYTITTNTKHMFHLPDAFKEALTEALGTK